MSSSLGESADLVIMSFSILISECGIINNANLWASVCNLQQQRPEVGTEHMHSGIQKSGSLPRGLGAWRLDRGSTVYFLFREEF